jgi:hypothetical protein
MVVTMPIRISHKAAFDAEIDRTPARKSGKTGHIGHQQTAFIMVSEQNRHSHGKPSLENRCWCLHCASSG